VVNHNHTPDEADKTVAEIEAAGTAGQRRRKMPRTDLVAL